MREQTACMVHGGKAPQALAKAQTAMELVDMRLRGRTIPAVDALEGLLRVDSEAVVLSAAKDVLDRRGLKAAGILTVCLRLSRWRGARSIQMLVTTLLTEGVQMHQRAIVVVRTVVVVAVMCLGVVRAAAQGDVPQQTAWGQPDLQGVWDFRSITPMQRPEDMTDKEFLTEEEAATFEQEAVDQDTRLWERAAQRTESGGDVGAYNNFWMDRGHRTVGTRRTSLIVDPPNGRMPSLTPAGQRRADERQEYREANPADSWVDFSAGVRCILGFNAGPPMTPSAYNNNMQLFQTPDHVVLVTEMVNTARVVPLDGRPRLHPAVRQWSGDSRGHWEGETLVIESRNFAEKRRWRGTTERAHLVERFTRVDADTLIYEFTVTDPETWTSPWTASVTMFRNPEPMYEYACHEGNYSMPVMLAGQRADEMAATGQP